MNKLLNLSDSQLKHFRYCPYVETCDFCDWVIKQLNKGCDINE